MENLLNLRQVAHLLNLSVRQVNNLIHQKRLPAWWTGSQWLVAQEDAAAFKFLPRPKGRPRKEQGK